MSRGVIAHTVRTANEYDVDESGRLVGHDREDMSERLIPQREPTTFEIFCMTSFNFPFGAICSPMGIALLPLESTHLFADSAPVALGCMMGIVGISQLICPIAGKISDSCRCSMGKRRPFVHFGNIISSLSILFMWWSSITDRGYCFMLGLLIAMIFLNVAYSGGGGLVPDLVPEELQGKSSGLVGVHLLSGAVSGFLFLMATYHLDFHYNYAFYIVLLALCSVLIHWKAKETSTAGLATVRHSMHEFLQCYFIDTSQGTDFLWVFIGRTLYYVGVSCQSFFLFYVHDLIHIEKESEQKLTVGSMGIVAQFCGALVTYPVGKLSDGPCGRKCLVYFACVVMCVVYIGFIFVPFISPPGDLVMIYVLMVVYGCGNGAFLSVDYALALDCIPDREQTAQCLGIWGVSAFLGLAIGPMLWGCTLDIARRFIDEFPEDGSRKYPFSAYVLMLLGGCMMVFCAGRCIYNVKKSK